MKIYGFTNKGREFLIEVLNEKHFEAWKQQHPDYEIVFAGEWPSIAIDHTEIIKRLEIQFEAIRGRKEI